MTDAINVSTVTNAIANASITVTNAYGTSGVMTITNVTGMPVSVNQQSCPMLTPHPTDFISNASVTRDTFGADAALKGIEYDLKYRFFFAPILQGTTMLAKYAALVDAAVAILLYFTTNTALSGTVDFLPRPIVSFGAVADGAGTQFHGCDFIFHVKQYLEV